LEPSGRVTFLESSGDVLGAFAQAQFGSLERKVRPGDRVVIYTDGLLERAGRTLVESLNTLGQAISRLTDAPLEDLPRLLADSMAPVLGADDVVALAFEA
jgi:sigma-B regulation protein RsbU (phosphoserine phosphatase)